MGERRHLRSFYLTLVVIAVAGVVLIVRQRAGGGGTESVTETLRDVPFTPIAAAGPVGHQLGPDSAPVEIAVFSDFSCPHCATFEILEFPLVVERIIPTGRLRWRFVDFPLQNNPNSPAAHLAGACAAEQGRFFEMMHEMFNRQGVWASERRPGRTLSEYAQRLGLDMSRFDECVDTRRAQPVVDAGSAEGERLGVDATPTFFVNGRKWPSVLGYDQIRAIVDSLAPPGGAPRAGTASGGGAPAPSPR